MPRENKAKMKPWLIILVMFIVAINAACLSDDTEKPGQPENPSSLVGTDWDLVTLDNQPVLPDTLLSIRFDKDEISGSAGCNSYFSVYKLDNEAITIGDIGSTEMYCDGIMEQESTFLQMLRSAKSVTLDQERLTIHTAEGDLVFRHKEDLPLAGIIWTLSGIAQGEAFASNSTDSEITLVFDSGQVSGFAGCNNFFAEYETEGSTLDLGPIGSTKMACEEDKNQREMELFAALEGVVGFSISRNALKLTDADNTVLMVFQAQTD